MRLYAVFEKLSGKEPKNKILAVPRIITIYQSCIKHKVQDILIKRLHFNDLHVLLMSLDISELKQAIKQLKREKMRSKDSAHVKELSPNDAVKFLKGGGI